MKRAYALVRGKCRITTTEMATIMDINVAFPWYKTPYSNHLHAFGINVQLNHARSISLSEISYSMTRYQQCCQSHVENIIPILQSAVVTSFQCFQDSFHGSGQFRLSNEEYGVISSVWS